MFTLFLSYLTFVFHLPWGGKAARRFRKALLNTIREAFYRNVAPDITCIDFGFLIENDADIIPIAKQTVTRDEAGQGVSELVVFRKITYTPEDGLSLSGKNQSEKGNMFTFGEDKLGVEELCGVLLFLIRLNRGIRNREFLLDKYVSKNGIVIADTAKSFLLYRN